MELRFSTRAQRQLEALKEYLRDQDRTVADRVGSSIRSAAKRLQDFPYMGHIGRMPGTRELGVSRLPYIIVYEVNIGDVDEVMVLGVFHGSQDRG
jgi:toxin ParE1/3/4